MTQIEAIRSQLDRLTTAIMNNDFNYELFYPLYMILTANYIPVPDSLFKSLYNIDVFIQHEMQEMALENLKELQQEINKKPSIADLKIIQKYVKRINESIDNDDINVHLDNLYKKRKSMKYNFEIALLLSNDCWETIDSNIEKTISHVQQEIPFGITA
jgi:predicted nucleotidyltransferase